MMFDLLKAATARDRDRDRTSCGGRRRDETRPSREHTRHSHGHHGHSCHNHHD
jgi:hypothetical protein